MPKPQDCHLSIWERFWWHFAPWVALSIIRDNMKRLDVFISENSNTNIWYRKKNSTFASNQRGLKRNKSIKPNTKRHEETIDNNDDGSGRNDRNG